jgi:hypothetical protein
MKTQPCLGLIVLWILLQNLPVAAQDYDQWIQRRSSQKSAMLQHQ